MIVLPMMTKDKEKYRCRFSGDQDANTDKLRTQSDTDQDDLEFLEELAKSAGCSYRVKQYKRSHFWYLLIAVLVSLCGTYLSSVLVCVFF